MKCSLAYPNPSSDDSNYYPTCHYLNISCKLRLNIMFEYHVFQSSIPCFLIKNSLFMELKSHFTDFLSIVLNILSIRKERVT